MNRVREVWAHRTASEYRSATVAAQYLHWLLQLGVSPDTVRLAHRVVADELDHAELCHRIAAAAGRGDLPAPVPDAWLVLTHEPDAPLALRALAVAADEYAVAETVALHLFKRMADLATAPEVAPAVARIVTDEARHSRLGWEAVEELLERTGDEGRALLAARVPGYLVRVREAYRSRAEPCTPEEERWGLMSPAVFDEIVPKALARVVSGFGRLGVEVSTPPEAT